MGEVVAVATLVVGAVAAGTSHRQQRKAAKKQKEANEIQQRKEDFKQQQQNARALAKQQELVAQQRSSAETDGTGQSSAVSGATGSVKTQTAANVGFASQISDMTKQQNKLTQSAAENMFRAKTYESAGKVAGSAISAGDTIYNS